MLARFADGAQALLKRRLQELLAQPQDEVSALQRARRAAHEAELWTGRLEHLQCVQAGLKLPHSSTLGSIIKFRCRLDSAVGQLKHNRQNPVLTSRFLASARTMLARLSPPDEEAIVVDSPVREHA